MYEYEISQSLNRIAAALEKIAKGIGEIIEPKLQPEVPATSTDALFSTEREFWEQTEPLSEKDGDYE